MKMKKWMKKNNLDEMQEQKLLKIEHNGCWLAFWGLFAVLVVQFIYYGPENWQIFVGEWLVFMSLCIYIVLACLKNGIWDRKFSPTPATNLAFSIGCGLCCGMLYFVISYREYHKLWGSLAVGFLMLVSAFALCFGGLTLAAYAYRKKTDQLENNDKEEEK